MKRTQSCLILIRPPSLNDILRRHFRVVQKVSLEWHEAVGWAVRAARMRPVETYPVEVRITARWRGDRRRDADNIFAKPVLDSLVECGILADDDTGHVTRVVLQGGVGCSDDSLTVEVVEG
jgi:Holliday junction resolvase RusA-like endonuclease